MATGPPKLNSGTEVLDEAECLRLIRTETVGRLGVIVDGRPEVYPVNFVLSGGDVMILTDEGAKLAAAVVAPVVFEVDHLDSDAHTGWSVMVHGSAHLTAAREGRPGAQSGPLRSWRSAVLPHILRIVPEAVTGRRIVALPHRNPASA
jgi:hypothetical protein